MTSAVQMGVWVTLGDNAAVRYALDIENEMVSFTFAGPDPNFTLVVTKEALRGCVETLLKALTELALGLAELESADESTSTSD